MGAKGRKVELPRAVVGLLDEILKNMQAGKTVSIVRMARMEEKAGTYDKVVLPLGAEDR